MCTSSRLRQLLHPFGFDPSPAQAEQINAYLDLLIRWNQKINLTAIRNPQECVTRHFGESLLVVKFLPLQGSLLDIGSGAGFPGLALKIAFPALSVTLLEPVAKKRAFLKEAARVAGLEPITARADRLEDWVAANPSPSFDFVTMRAVGNLEQILPLIAHHCLKPGAQLLLWLSQQQGQQLQTIETGVAWTDPLPIPLTRAAEIWRGIKPSTHNLDPGKAD